MFFILPSVSFFWNLQPRPSRREHASSNALTEIQIYPSTPETDERTCPKPLSSELSIQATTEDQSCPYELSNRYRVSPFPNCASIQARPPSQMPFCLCQEHSEQNHRRESTAKTAPYRNPIFE